MRGAGGGLGVPGSGGAGLADVRSFADALAPAAAAVIAAAAAGGALALVMRRLTGGFTAPPPGGVWVVAAAGIGLVAAADRVAGRSAAGWVARLGLAMAVAAVGLPLHAGEWTSLAAVVMASAVCLLPPQAGATVRRRERPVRASAPAPRRRRLPAERPPARDRGGENRVPGRLVQRLERYDTPQGQDCLRGRVHLSIPPGGRGTHAHVGFCPAFSEIPLVRVTTDYDGVEAVVTAAEVLPWGVRVECRLAERAEEPVEIPVDVFVQAPR